MFGVQWNWPINQGFIEHPAGGNGHALYAVGWITHPTNGQPYLKVPNSYGTEAGIDGFFYFSREVINQYVVDYGAFTFIDMTPEEYLERQRYENLSLFEKILEGFLGILKSLVPQKVEPIIMPDEVLPPPAPPMPHSSKIQAWAEAIEVEEGGQPNDRNIRNKNPGNLKFTSLTKSLGATGHDANNFCIFPTREKGLSALCSFLTLACNNQLKDYHDKTLAQFTQIYAHPPLLHPYAQNVATKLGVTVNTPIKDFL